MPDNCSGGFGVKDDLCVEGTLGPLCESCDLLGKKWGERWY